MGSGFRVTVWGCKDDGSLGLGPDCPMNCPGLSSSAGWDGCEVPCHRSRQWEEKLGRQHASFSTTSPFHSSPLPHTARFPVLYLNLYFSISGAFFLYIRLGSSLWIVSSVYWIGLPLVLTSCSCVSVYFCRYTIINRLLLLGPLAHRAKCTLNEL